MHAFIRRGLLTAKYNLVRHQIDIAYLNQNMHNGLERVVFTGLIIVKGQLYSLNGS